MYTDEELLDKFFHGDNPAYAFNLIVRKYQQQVYWHVRRLVICHEDANDIVQDVFVKAWKALKNFRGDSGLGHGLGNRTPESRSFYLGES